MAGNVNEWVMDVYRETSYEEVSEYNSFRGNIYSKPFRDADGNYKLDSLGCISIYYNDSLDDKRDYKDGDLPSRIMTDYPLFPEVLTENTIDSIYHLTDSLTGEFLTREQMDSVYQEMYDEAWNELGFKKDPTDVLAPHPSKTARVYKGGSWRDRIYWLSPSSRRFTEQNNSSCTIGFRCAMSILGEQQLTK